MDAISLPLESGLPVTCFGTHEVVEVALGLSSFLRGPLGVLPSGHMTEPGYPAGGGETPWSGMSPPRRGDSRRAAAQPTWQQPRGAWMNSNASRRTAQLGSAQIPDQ